MVDILVVQRTIVDRLIGKTVGTLLLLHQVDVPVDTHVVGIRGNHIFQADRTDIETQHIIVALNGIDILQVFLRVIGHQAHGEDEAFPVVHSQVAARIRLAVHIRTEVELRRVDNTVVGEKRQVELGSRRVKHDELQRIIRLIFLQFHLLKETAEGA